MDWQIFLALERFRYIEVLFHTFYSYLGKKKMFIIPRTWLYRGLLYRGSTVGQCSDQMRTLRLPTQNFKD